MQAIDDFIGAFLDANAAVPNFNEGEWVLDDWYNRLVPLTFANVVEDLVTMYNMNRELIDGNAVNVNDFDRVGTNGTGVVDFNTKTNGLSLDFHNLI